MQAARAAEYSIAQFSFLTRLLFVHGRSPPLYHTHSPPTPPHSKPLSVKDCGHGWP